LLTQDLIMEINTDNVVQVHLIDEANDTDYYEMYAYQSSGGSTSSEGRN
jgi:hypothetical protein